MEIDITVKTEPEDPPSFMEEPIQPASGQIFPDYFYSSNKQKEHGNSNESLENSHENITTPTVHSAMDAAAELDGSQSYSPMNIKAEPDADTDAVHQAGEDDDDVDDDAPMDLRCLPKKSSQILPEVSYHNRTATAVETVDNEEHFPPSVAIKEEPTDSGPTSSCLDSASLYYPHLNPMDNAASHQVVQGSFRCLWPTCPAMFSDSESMLHHVQCHQVTSLQCTICGKTLQTDHMLLQHMGLHEQGFLHFCQQADCVEGFKTKTELAKHTKIHTRPQYACDVCGKAFSYKTHLKKHSREHKQEPLACNKDGCSRTFPNEEKLQKHQESYHEHYECIFCGRVFPIQKKLNQHLRGTHGSKTRFMCTHPGCDRGFSIKDSLRKHMISHSEERTYKCDACGVAFKYDHTLRNHKNRQSMQPEYRCDVDECGEVFPMGCILKQHRLTAHNASTEVTCSKCGLLMPTAELLLHQRAVHKQDEPVTPSPTKSIPCPSDDCNRFFTTKASCGAHWRRCHSEKLREKDLAKRSIYCSYCGLTFLSADSLSTHTSDRNNGKNHVCPEKKCHKIFSSSCMIKMHLVVHHQRNPFPTSLFRSKPYLCPHEGCRHSFDTSRNLRRHFTVYHKYWQHEDLFTCAEESCGKAFKFKIFLEDHMYRKHKQKTNVLDNSADSLETVYSDPPEDGDGEGEPKDIFQWPIQCNICGRECCNLKSTRRHLRFRHQEDARFTCSFADCRQTFKNVPDFRLHWKTCPGWDPCNTTEECPDPPHAVLSSVKCEHMPPSFYGLSGTNLELLCPTCGKSFSRRSSFYRHQRVMHPTVNSPVFACDFPGCDKVFRLRDYLQKHQKAHQLDENFEAMRYKCDMPNCDRSYQSRGALTRHKKRHTQVKGPRVQFNCPRDDCSARFFSKDKLKEHLNMHAGAFDCPVCNKTLNSSYSLTVHMSHHSPEKKVHCQVEGCGKSFHHKRELQRHMRYHMGIRKYPCPKEGCSAAFYFPCQMNQHLAMHEKGQVFCCGQCNKCYLSMSDVLRHRLLVHGVKPGKKTRVPCQVPGCGMTFQSSYGCRRHMQVIHKRSMSVFSYACVVEGCDMTFIRKSSLETHIKRHHHSDDTEKKVVDEEPDNQDDDDYPYEPDEIPSLPPVGSSFTETNQHFSWPVYPQPTASADNPIFPGMFPEVPHARLPEDKTQAVPPVQLSREEQMLIWASFGQDGSLPTVYPS